MASKITRRESREAPSDQESERGRHRCEWGRTAWTANHELSPRTHPSDPSPLTHTHLHTEEARWSFRSEDVKLK